MSVTLSVDGRYFVTGVPKATRLQTLLARDAWYCMVWQRDSCQHGMAERQLPGSSRLSDSECFCSLNISMLFG